MTEELSLAFPVTSTTTAGVDLAAIVADHAQVLYRVAHAILRNPAEAEDVVQDTFVRTLEHQHKLPSIRDLRPWLIRIAWNLAIDRRRRIRPDQMDDAFARSLAGHHLPADAALHEARQMALVLRTIDALPKSERQALLLSTVDELSTTEVAVIMGKSESAIRSLVHRARTHLRSRLDQGGTV